MTVGFLVISQLLMFSFFNSSVVVPLAAYASVEEPGSVSEGLVGLSMWMISGDYGGEVVLCCR